MAKLTVTGKSTRKVHCDTMELTLSFFGAGPTPARALEEVTRQSEAFLADLEKLGFDISKISLGENGVSKNAYREKAEFSARRELVFSTGFNMAFLNTLTDMVQEKHYSAEISTEFRYSDLPGLQRELLAEALKDSRRKAEGIAEATGEFLTGLHTMEHMDSGMDRFGERERSLPPPGALPGAKNPLLSDRLEAPTHEETVTVEAVWLMT